jgi:hypothetical protein
MSFIRWVCSDAYYAVAKPPFEQHKANTAPGRAVCVTYFVPSSQYAEVHVYHAVHGFKYTLLHLMSTYSRLHGLVHLHCLQKR